ncbi:MAG TPA: hypothetical protein DEO84_08915 [candidate division Zixibacteria bacterium]|jgi:uncharacterized damage-inducible protein DinB|nr:hypothetical protein [candidate division Zixibacteria bacterium]
MTINGTMKIATIANFWLNELRPPLDKALLITPDDKLEWTPGPDMITLGNIFMHIAEASDYWITQVIDHKDCIDYTPCPCPPKAEIAAMLDSHWLRIEEFFSRAPQIMEGTYLLQRRSGPAELSGFWIMLHLLEHDIHHRCQINQYLRIMGIEPPQI